MTQTDPLSTYLAALNSIRATGRATEHSYRAAFAKFLESQRQGVTALNEPQRRVDLGAPDYEVRTDSGLIGRVEVKDLDTSLYSIENDSKKGAPTTDEGRQLKRYRQRIDNLLFSNYLEVRWYREGQRVAGPLHLATVGPSGRLVPAAHADEAVQIIRAFLSVLPVTATSAETLAQEMASYAQLIRYIINQAFIQNMASIMLRDLKAQITTSLLTDLSDDDLADMVAQTLAYGLFAARVHQHSTGGTFHTSHAASLVPRTNPLLRDLFHRLFDDLDFNDEPYAGIVNNIFDLLLHADMDKVLQDFSKRSTPEHPIVHFYETFLAKYNPAERDRRGVFYTPPQVVSYITRSIDSLLRSKQLFGVTQGLAASEMNGDYHRVLLLDPACGTGTFLEQAIVRIRDSFKGNAGLWPGYVEQHLLPRLFGFERLMAPYVIAHLHLSTVLEGQDLNEPERSQFSIDLDRIKNVSGGQARLGVYLANTLEQPVTSGDLLKTSFIAREAHEAAEVKRDIPIMVVVGNPPYRARSSNPSYRETMVPDKKGSHLRRTNTWIGDQIEVYKSLVVTDKDGNEISVSINERNAQSLHDDYVKFMRFAEWRIEQTGVGILGFITNHGYLDNPTFRGMRQHLLRTFDVLHVLDLGGNPIKNLGRSDPDENVFDIRDAGVAIALFVKTSQSKELGRLYHHSRRGTRTEKENYLSTHSVDDTEWEEISPRDPDYFFVPRTLSLQDEWESHKSVVDIFTLFGPGIKTNRDNLTLHLDPAAAWSTAVDFVRLPEPEARERWSLPPTKDESKGWHYESAKTDLKNSFSKRGFRPGSNVPGSPEEAKSELVRPITYRPFDTRWTIWTGTTQGFIAWPSIVAMKHYLNARDEQGMYRNVGLVTARQNASGRADHFFVTRLPSEMKTAESTRGSLTFPLYRYLNEGDVQSLFGANREPAVSFAWVESLKQFTGLRYTGDGPGDLEKSFGPEDVLAYVYGTLYSHSYREHFSEQLRSDYARVPLPMDIITFRDISMIGRRLIELHTADPDGTELTGPVSFPVAGSNEVESLAGTSHPPRYTPAGYTLPNGDTTTTGRVWLQAFPKSGEAAPQYFAGIAPDVWAYTIGGHQVLLKWLRSRLGRTLSADDLSGFIRIANALQETLGLQDAVDIHVRKLLGRESSRGPSGAVAVEGEIR